MRSRTPKELHPVCGRAILDHVLKATLAAKPDQLIVVLSPAKSSVVDSLPEGCEVAWQTEQLGTGHAAAQALPLLKPTIERVAILFGDHPLLTADAVNGLIARSSESRALVTLLTAVLDDPRSYGRLRFEGDHIVGIVEAKEDQNVYSGPVEINSGISCYDRNWLESALPSVTRSSVGEYYLTSLVSMAAAERSMVKTVASVQSAPEIAYGVNDRVELSVAEGLMRQRINERLMRSGVTIVDPATTFIHDTVTVEPDARIEPFTTITGESRIGELSTIGPNSTIHDTVIGRECNVIASTLESSRVGDRVSVGPYSHFRPGASIDNDVRIGNYVEIKNSTVGSGTDIHHFCYIGDATIGRDVNIAAGTITANYDGTNKHRTVIEDGAFIGCDTILRAPVTVSRTARTGAGSVVTRDVSPGVTVVGIPARPINLRRRGERDQREETEG